ncbi:M20 family metallo-hydrolase [Halobacterium salinarum]|uniref:M20 family metallo-hydrolase n=1 Tax=Halobacterium salinarum TaxID=2242 RepID=UPI001F388C2D|nr:M20 family metallo-hydrolase [Halobacterium salinarum]MCF2207666.1 M20 family metallo-hydrolase [Halobacterium salinarum]MCF2240856.1 M20 family metallo-hydrolase [Halobacterium salinarum]
MDYTDPAVLTRLRRDLHGIPEPAWCEFQTTARVVDACEDIGVDTLHVGPQAVASDARMAVPDDDTLADWRATARDAGVDEALLDSMAGGHTGAIAVLDRGEGPTVGLRVDIDALHVTESEADDHHPAGEGFRSEHDGCMHACGHDGHATIGVGVLAAVADSDFQGTLKVVFQPAEERAGGGKPIAESGHLDDVDYLYAVHLGLDHPTGEVVAGVDGFLAVSHLRADFTGTGAHAGSHPEDGRNAIQAMATAIQNLHAIPRHDGGATRVNAGRAGGGTAPNIVPDSAFLEGEVRGETTALMEYMKSHADRVVRSAAEMHDCTVETATEGQAPSAESDRELAACFGAVAADRAGVDSVLDSDALGGSEDATYLMRRVQNTGGMACYVCVGTDHPGGHHTPTFDVDEQSLRIGVGALTTAITRVAETRP